VSAAAEVVAARAPGFTPRAGLMLGSGLGELADRLEERVAVGYGELPGFHAGGLAGHAGQLVLGRLAGVPVAIFSGRWHVYEGIEGGAITSPIRMLKTLGAEALVLTNAAGSLRRETAPGSLVCISDHINLLGFNPLTGPNDEAAGPRFPSLRNAYDPELRAGLHRAAEALGIRLHDGVYLAVAGPSFETPAEIRAFRTLGADLVGMSTVPEVIAARHAGLRVAAVSAVTNLAEGMGGEELSHEQTLRVAHQGAAALGPLLERFLEDWAPGRADDGRRAVRPRGIDS
jgi:xanthosine phosphorylase